MRRGTDELIVSPTSDQSSRPPEGSENMAATTALQDRAELGKVAQVLNERELVINLGTAEGVRRGMKYAVLAATPTQITDPDTGDVLGEIDRDKVRVQVIEVQDHLAVARTYEGKVVGGGLGSLFPEFMIGHERMEYKTFHYSTGSVPGPIEPNESYVKIGDRVKRLPD